MMKLSILVIHCTDTPKGRNVTAADIRQWHLSPVAEGGRGWKQVGYSDMILLDGTLVNLVPYDDDNIVEAWELTNGVAGINGQSRHVVYVGGSYKGKPKDTRTQAQLQTLEQYVKATIQQYPLLRVAGHNQFAKKACPSFAVAEWLQSIGVQDKNIYK
jgi:N-acetylmuramoyl-L-alanine amidase